MVMDVSGVLKFLNGAAAPDPAIGLTQVPDVRAGRRAAGIAVGRRRAG